MKKRQNRHEYAHKSSGKGLGLFSGAPLCPGRGENGGCRAKLREKAARENRKGAGTKQPERAKILAGRRAKTTNAGLEQANRDLGRTNPTWVSTSQGLVYSFGARLCRNPPARHSFSPLILPTLTAETRFLLAQVVRLDPGMSGNQKARRSAVFPPETPRQGRREAADRPSMPLGGRHEKSPCGVQGLVDRGAETPRIIGAARATGRSPSSRG